MNGENVCAVVLDYYGAEKTEKCLLSLSGQGLRTVYVLDNSGSDDAALKLRDVLARLESAGIDYRIELLSAGKNLGFARGVNFVLSHDRRSGSPHGRSKRDFLFFCLPFADVLAVGVYLLTE